MKTTIQSIMAILLLVTSSLSMAGCGQSQNVSAQKASVTSNQSKHVNMGSRDVFDTYDFDDTVIAVDKHTNCQYFEGGYGIRTPRLDKDGKPICGVPFDINEFR